MKLKFAFLLLGGSALAWNMKVWLVPSSLFDKVITGVFTGIVIGMVLMSILYETRRKR